ncbi:MAG: hypothetical protein DHS20C12_01830 [Pseudohongiella sp.]|nr:MAG: hypothetical protein DHS20C12_01830 [Pseudohongiella sp.]
MSTDSPAENANLVSIICRTLGRLELQQALKSIAAQDYPAIEIVLVDASGEDSLDSSASGDRSLRLVTTHAPLSRSQAANAGLEAASGKYIQFLDDDDWIAPNHISQLVATLEANDDLSVAYSSTQKTNSKGESLDYVFDQDFDPILLMRDNYIPIHAILFEGALLRNGCRFDEAFDIYEDWDFWLQLSQHTDFQHIDSITAFYREGGDSETAAEDTRLRYAADNALGRSRAAIFEKWLPEWTGERMNALIGQLDQSVLLCEQDARIHSELKRNADLQHEIEKRDMQVNELNQRLTEAASQLEQLKQVSSQHIHELEQRLNSIYGSTSWKLMGPVRRIARAVSKNKNSEIIDSDADE